MAVSSLGGQIKGLREAVEFQRNGKQAPELTKASSVAINDDRTHVRHNSCGRMALSQSAESYSKLKNEWKKRWIGGGVQTLSRCKCPLENKRRAPGSVVFCTNLTPNCLPPLLREIPCVCRETQSHSCLRDSSHLGGLEGSGKGLPDLQRLNQLL